MKKVALTLIAVALALTTVMAQAPQSINYQGVARDNTGSILSAQSITLQISILSGSSTGTVEYSETHATTTNQFGLFTLQIGNGTVVSGNFSTIDWGANTHYAKVEMDENGGANYQLMGTSQLLSVPYALHAENVTNDNINDADADPTNELQVLSISNDTIYLSNGGYVILPPDQTADADADPTNELQALSVSNDTLYLSNGGTVYFGNYLDNTDNQTLSLSNDTLTISNGNNVVLTDNVNDADADSTNELQNFSTSGDTLFLSNSNFVIIPGLYDANIVCEDSVQDADGNWYDIVKIGSKCWMAENLNVGTYVTVATGQGTGGTQKYCQNLSGVNDPACPFGGLYEWAEMMDGSGTCNGTGAPPNDECTPPVQGICPSGWHIPSHYEWTTTLERNVGSNPGAFPYDITTIGWLGTDEGGNLKQTGTANWTTPNTGATNSSGFTALPGGYSWSGSFYDVGSYGYWWSSTESGTSAWFRYLDYTEARSYRNYYYKLYGFSVRCVQD